MIYFIIRFFSYFFSPGTPLYNGNPTNWIISAGILSAAIYFISKKDERGWLIIAAEITLGGAGGFLEIAGISLRTLLLISSMAIFFYQIKKGNNFNLLLKNKLAFLILVALGISAFISAFIAKLYGHDPKLILADFIPYCFFLYYFPLKQLLLSENFRHTVFNMLLAGIIGNFIFIFFTLAGFSSHLFVLQDSYYHWFRDVAAGKITDYGTGFFRIITNEQLLLVPLFLWLFSKAVNNQKQPDAKLQQAACILLLAVLAISLTRIYFVALAVGILLLFSFKNWRRWFIYSSAAFFIFIFIFISTNLAATRGKSFGLEYLGLRLQSIALPQTEESSLSRLLLLPKILDQIKDHPALGNGLGDTVTVYSPVFEEYITTPHFDWGYLEIIAEMGVLGLAIWLTLCTYCWCIITCGHQEKNFQAPLLALLIINITSPALFHVMGIIFLAIFLANAKPATWAGPISCPLLR